MKNKFSKSWNSSIKPNKQRKYRFNAPLHIKSSFLNAHLSKELRQKHGIRSLRIRLGDRVKIMRGQFKKQDAKVEEINIKKSIVYLSKIEHTKRDGTKARYPINPSNIMIIELNNEDRKRLSKIVKEKKVVEKKTLEQHDVNGSVSKSELQNSESQNLAPKAVKSERVSNNSVSKNNKK